jgi:hypothetical protein
MSSTENTEKRFFVCREIPTDKKVLPPQGQGASGESASHRFSRKNTLSLRPPRLERVTPSRDEWAVKKGFEDINYFLLPVIIQLFSFEFRWFFF